MTTVSSTTSSTAATTTTTSSTTTSSSTSTSTSTDYKTFNTSDLVEAKLASRYTRLDSLNAKVNSNQAKVTAYQDMQSRLQAMNTALEKLRANPSSTGKTTDVFRDRTSYLTSSTSSSAGTYMSASVAEGTELGSHTVKIGQVAKTNILGSASQTSKTDAMKWTASFSIGVSGGTAAQIDVSSTMSLSDIADAINNQKGTTGVKASVMKVADSQFKLVLTTVDTGKTITASDVTGSLLSTDLGILDSGGAVQPSAVLQAAQNAQFTVDGVPVTRSSNDVSDVLDGVTLHLYAAPADDATLTLEVDHDLSAIKSTITDFVNAYNSFRDFVIANQNTATDGTASSSATLFGDNILRSTALQLQSALSASAGGSDLRSIGIKFDINNKLTIDDTTLSNKLQDDLDSVQSLFSYQMTSSAGELGMIRHPNKSMTFDLRVMTDSFGQVSYAAINNDSSMFDVSGGTIRGKTGTEYEGLTLVYLGNTQGGTDKTINVKLSQGIADQLFHAVDTVSSSTKVEGTDYTSALTDKITQLLDTNDDLNKDITSLQGSISTYRQSLTTLYANMAGKVSMATNTVDLLKALLKASYGNN